MLKVVIASEAKQSMVQQKEKSGLRRFARNDETGSELSQRELN